MKLKGVLLALVSITGLLGQQTLGTVNAETPEGALLQQIGQETDAAKKHALLEEFAGKYPKHESVGWVYSQLQAAYLNANNADKALEYGTRLAEHDANDLEAAHQNLKAAEAKKDPDLVKKWAAETSVRARKTAARSKPEDVEDEIWKHRVDFAKQVDTYSEYALYGTALQVQDPNKKIELAQSLRERNPNSGYMTKLAGLEFASYQQLGQIDKALAVAEAIVAKEQTNEEVLIFLADQYRQKKKDPAKTIEYANKVVEVLGAKPAPAGVDAAAWETRKNTFTGTAHFLAGTTYYDQGKLADADKSLREALPLVGGNEQIKAYTLYFLGQSNHKLKKLSDALGFFSQCAAIKSPVQGAAAQNTKALQQQGVGAARKK